MEVIFSSIYKKKIWGCNNEGNGTSGVGSTLEATAHYRDFLQRFMDAFAIKTVVDAGCGDWEFSQAIDWSAVDYIGYDVVPFIIEQNIAKYGADNVTFIHKDIMNEELSPADLLICKDVLMHWSNELILKFLEQLPKFKYCLITGDIDYKTDSSYNPNIRTGGFRALDLTQAPFFLDGIKIFSYSHGNMKKQVLLIISEPFLETTPSLSY
jgi:SAM-dependent methyltransferase